MTSTLLDLLLPGACVWCAEPGDWLCGRCAVGLARPHRHTPWPVPPDLPPLWTAGSYAGAVRAAILAYKESGRRGLATVLGAALGCAVEQAVGRAVSRSGDVWLVPVPSRRSVARSRGGDHVCRLAQVAVRHLRHGGVRARVDPALRVVGRPRDSAGLGAAARITNLSGVFAVGARRAPPVGARLVVVDDVVTSGATLSEAVRTLTGAGRPPVAAAVVAATPRMVRR